ncbi:hypothetical protein Prudu_023209 [Prunus dulcis]|uniref:glutathione transferase n=1 Tax=Prunus dulcis TaxID=3755 RepID=A0A4Y1S268_PRUDU|nr:hypothetical protein Prudu_023209 [Prunus dulcis]
MATIKVYGSTYSTVAMRVFAALYEKDIEFEFVPVDMRAGEHKKEPIISLNTRIFMFLVNLTFLCLLLVQPFGQIPAFEDGDLKLFESRAITQYIAHEYFDKGTQLVIRDSKKMAILSVWTEVEGQKFDPAASKLTWELGIKPLLGMPTDSAIPLSRAISFYATDFFYATEPGKTNKIKKGNEFINRV